MSHTVIQIVLGIYVLWATLSGAAAFIAFMSGKALDSAPIAHALHLLSVIVGLGFIGLLSR